MYRAYKRLIMIKGEVMKEDYLNDPKYREMQLILEEEEVRINRIKESEFRDDDFIDIIATRIADITLVLGETGYNLFDKTIAKRMINAEIEK